MKKKNNTQKINMHKIGISRHLIRGLIEGGGGENGKIRSDKSFRRTI